MTQKIYRFEAEAGSDKLQSDFVACDEEIAWIVGREIRFGDASGKQDSVSLTMKPEYFTVVSDNPVYIGDFKDVFTENFNETISSTKDCPFNHLNEEQRKEYEAKNFGSQPKK
jgi:hypothetical protein